MWTTRTIVVANENLVFGLLSWALRLPIALLVRRSDFGANKAPFGLCDSSGNGSRWWIYHYDARKHSRKYNLGTSQSIRTQ